MHSPARSAWIDMITHLVVKIIRRRRRYSIPRVASQPVQVEVGYLALSVTSQRLPLTSSLNKNTNFGFSFSLSFRTSSNPLPCSRTLPATALMNFCCSKGTFANHFSRAVGFVGGGVTDELDEYELDRRLRRGDRESVRDLERVRPRDGLGERGDRDLT